MYPVLILRTTATAAAHTNDIFIVGQYRFINLTVTTADGTDVVLTAAAATELRNRMLEVSKYGVVEIS